MKIDKLDVRIFPSRKEMGKVAAKEFSDQLRLLLAQHENVRTVFAAAPSQNDFLAELIQYTDMDWSRVTVFHMDEYLGLPKDSPAILGKYLHPKLFDHLPFGKIEYMDPNPLVPEAECRRYAALLQQAPIDMIALGIGENGHLAYNDPPVADFNDPEWVKVIELDNSSRHQAVHDGTFASETEVPKLALTMTIPAMTSGRYLYCIVPGRQKAAAVKAALEGPVSTACPASILRQHDHTWVYLDEDAASLLRPLS